MLAWLQLGLSVSPFRQLAAWAEVSLPRGPPSSSCVAARPESRRRLEPQEPPTPPDTMRWNPWGCDCRKGPLHTHLTGLGLGSADVEGGLSTRRVEGWCGGGAEVAARSPLLRTPLMRPRRRFPCPPSLNRSALGPSSSWTRGNRVRDFLALSSRWRWDLEPVATW